MTIKIGKSALPSLRPAPLFLWKNNSMMSTLRFFLISSRNDRQMIKNPLVHAIEKHVITQIGSREEFETALEHGQFDLVITAYALNWSNLKAVSADETLP
jgi:hypothetical protein